MFTLRQKVGYNNADSTYVKRSQCTQHKKKRLVTPRYKLGSNGA